MSESEKLFWAKVDTDGDCLVWIGHRHYKGYGLLNRSRRVMKAHRFIYELLIEEIPKGLQLDHLCRNRACVNPNHLEPVTNRENVVRGNTVLNKKFGLPVGVALVGRRYMAQKRIDGRNYYLGMFSTPTEAHLVYANFKGEK